MSQRKIYVPGDAPGEFVQNEKAGDIAQKLGAHLLAEIESLAESDSRITPAVVCITLSQIVWVMGKMTKMKKQKIIDLFVQANDTLRGN